MHLVAFEIDGTLVDSDEFDAELYVQAVRNVLGVSIDRDWDRYDNVTDSGILEQILNENDYPKSRVDIHFKVRTELLSLTESFLAKRPGTLREINGARELIENLKSRMAVAVAIATGGWEETAKLKLQGIGLNLDELAVATASDATSRIEIMKIAETRSLNGRIATKKTYFGDGIWDKKASEELNYDFIGVGAGVKHHTIIADLCDHAAIIEQLGV